MEVSASKPEPDITIKLSYTEAQRLRAVLFKYEGGNPVPDDRQKQLRLHIALEDAGVMLP